MSKRGNGYSSENRLNILKKVKVGTSWNLYPAVVEPNGKLRDKVRVHGKVEVHPEGYCYIEWWQDGRKREQVKDRAEVLDCARRKAIELQANRAGIETRRMPAPLAMTMVSAMTWSASVACRIPSRNARPTTPSRFKVILQ